MRRPLAAIIGLLLLGQAATADVELMTPDGRRVLLRDDQTWEYVAENEDTGGEHVLLAVDRKVDLLNGCMFGLRLTNNTRSKVKSLIPQFSAFTRDNLRYDTVFMAFGPIKPTRYQYREISFFGITCGDIVYVKVVGADRCTMGDLDRYNAADGECLSRIRVAPSDLVKIFK